MGEMDELVLNEYFLLVNESGYYLKTKFQEDFEDVANWGGILFSGKVPNSQFLFFRVGLQIIKKRIAELHTAQPQTATGWYDVETLDLKHGNSINKCWTGKKAQNYENL
jgi:hypothetical protein